jgi:hypothetical protein
VSSPTIERCSPVNQPEKPQLSPGYPLTAGHSRPTALTAPASQARIRIKPSQSTTDRFPNHADPEVHRSRKVVLQMAVMARGGDIVLPLTVLPDERRAFEACHEEGRENCVPGHWRIAAHEALSPFAAAGECRGRENSRFRLLFTRWWV